jgi:hypothetical protein
MTDTPNRYLVTLNNPYEGTKGYKIIENFPHCGDDKIHLYVIFALKYLIRLGKKEDVRKELKKAIAYLARAYYLADVDNFKPDDLTETFKDY